MDILTLDIPWPLSVNHYWEQRGAMRFLSSKALNFRREVKHAFLDTQHPGFGGIARLSLKIMLFPPDKRRRDIDNILKCTMDSLEHAGVYEDDSQIDMLQVVRVPSLGNCATVVIECL